MKKIFITATVTSLLFASLMSSGCKSEEPKEQPATEAKTSTIQAAADKAHEVIDKTAVATQTLAEKAAEIKAAARKAATDMSATITKGSEQASEKEAATQEAPAVPAEEAHK